MKGKTKQQKGITLIALIITIVVLLILAVVTIGAIKNDSIISYADNSTEKYKDAQTKEEETLGYYESYLAGTLGTWKQEGLTLTKTNADGTKMQIKIGEYVNYDEGTGHTHTPDTTKGAGTSETGGDSGAGYTLGASELTTEDLKWRVLGLNAKGEIELISADPDPQPLYLANDEGYLNAETTYNEDGTVKELGTLDKFCNDLYGQGKDSKGNKLATGARSLNVEDINKLTKYDPKTYSGYGNIWTYKYPTDAEVSASTTGLTKNMWYRTDKVDGTQVKDWTNITGSSYQKFRLPNEEKGIGEISNSEIIEDKREVECTSYSYSISSILTTEDGFTADEATAISNMICKGTTSSYITQLLASRCVVCDSNRANFYVRGVYNGRVNYLRLFGSYGYFSCSHYRVRPVVSLKSDISLSGSGDSVGTVDNMWQIS